MFPQNASEIHKILTKYESHTHLSFMQYTLNNKHIRDRITNGLKMVYKVKIRSEILAGITTKISM